MTEERDRPRTEAQAGAVSSRRRARIYALLSSAGLMGVVAGAVFLLSGIAGAEPGETTADDPVPGDGATVEATASPSLPPAPVTKPDKPPAQPPAVPTLSPGPIEADRAVVYTGDGDCLNVRPVPSLQFESDPRFCLNEGEVVYLYGESIESDGHVWRYALGRGWLATQYVRMEPREAGELLDGFDQLLLQTTTWNEPSGTVTTEYVSLDASGQLRPGGSIEYRQWGIGSGNPVLSPNGRFSAVTTSDDVGSTLTLLVVDLSTGAEQRIDNLVAGSWSSDGRLLVYQPCWGPEGCTFTFGIFEPQTGDVSEFVIEGEKEALASWLPDNSGVIAVAECSRLYRVDFGGAVEFIGEPGGGDFCYSGLLVSPDGRSGLAGSVYGPLRVVDLDTAATRDFQRADRIVEPAGRCGGSIGQLVDLIDGRRFVYHESLAAKGSNGITIGDLETGSRHVLSFWNIADLQVVGAERVTFTSFEQMNDLSFQLTWLLDTSTGEARPVAVGMEAGWVK